MEASKKAKAVSVGEVVDFVSRVLALIVITMSVLSGEWGAATFFLLAIWYGSWLKANSKG